MKKLVTEYQQNEGRRISSGARWMQKIWTLKFLTCASLFKEYNEIKITSIAANANLNPSLLRQYATGNKYPSAEQAKKIESAVHDLAKKLQSVPIYTE